VGIFLTSMSDISQDFKVGDIFSWFRYHRDGESLLAVNLPLPPEPGGGAIPIGGTVNSVFDFDIIKAKYNYSLIMNDRYNLKLGGGLYVMPMKFGVSRVGTNTVAEESITAPLPVVGLGFDAAITPKWIFKSNLDVFYLSVDEFKGSRPKG